MASDADTETEGPLSQGTLDALCEDIRQDNALSGLTSFTGTRASNAVEHRNFDELPQLSYISQLPPCAESLRLEMNPRDSFLITEEIFNNNTLLEKPTPEDFLGEFDFRATFEHGKQKITKAMSWTHHESLNKLFCTPESSVPIRFKYSKDVPSGAIIRGIVIPRNDFFVVQRCPAHITIGAENGKHFFSSNSKNATYGQCSNSGINFLMIPAPTYQAGLDYHEEHVRFHCYSSCPGICKRELLVLFTLEHGKKVIGRSSFCLKVCACPGRDRKEGATRKRGIDDINNKGSKDQLYYPSDSDSDNKLYHITVRGKKTFRKLVEIKQGYELQEDGRIKDLPKGQFVPLERTASGGVDTWLLKESGDKLKTENKIYLQKKEEKKEVKSPKEES